MTELHTLITRCGEMAAEIERLHQVADITNKELRRLQSVIDEANSQEPVAVQYKNGEVLTKAQCRDVFEICCRAQTPLFARPIPAQQSPAVAVPSTLCKQLEVVSNRLERDGLWVLRDTVKLAISALSSPRITEQDARLATIKANAVREFCKEIGLFDPEYADNGYIEVSRHALKEYCDDLPNKISGK